jgi:hypothetical protein
MTEAIPTMAENMETKFQIQDSLRFNVYSDDRKAELSCLSIPKLVHMVFGPVELNLNYVRQCVMTNM